MLVGRIRAHRVVSFILSRLSATKVKRGFFFLSPQSCVFFALLPFAVTELFRGAQFSWWSRENIQLASLSWLFFLSYFSSRPGLNLSASYLSIRDT